MDNLDKNMKHIPIMTREILEHLVPQDKECRIIDGTLGYAGHSNMMLRANERAQLLGIDRDSDALAYAQELLSYAGNRVNLVRGSFSEMKQFAKEINWDSVDAILLDVGISSPQIDDALRGFAHRFDGPLDMRMDKRNPNTASRVLNRYSEEELARIFKEYGEIRSSKKLAAEIVKRRTEKSLTKTSELKQICEELFGKAKPGCLPTATLCFQALRIEVNNELEQLEKALKEGINLLASGGRIGVITFHSLEDRIVKNIFKEFSTDCICPPGLPICVCKHKAQLKVVNKKPFVPHNDEVRFNSRSACAKLRIAEKI